MRRAANGNFVSLMDFASRVDLRKGGIRALNSLAKSGHLMIYARG